MNIGSRVPYVKVIITKYNAQGVRLEREYLTNRLTDRQKGPGEKESISRPTRAALCFLNVILLLHDEQPP